MAGGNMLVSHGDDGVDDLDGGDDVGGGDFLTNCFDPFLRYL